MAPSSQRTPTRRLIYATTGLIAAIWVLIDQATKQLAVVRLEGRPAVDLGILDLNVVRNPGGAFSIPGLFPGLFVLVTVIVLVLVARALPHTDRLSLALGYGLVTGGAIGNAIDRVARDPGFPNGHVVDMIDLRWWPIFNVADMGIVVGALLVGLLMFRLERAEQRAEASAAAPSPPPKTAPRPAPPPAAGSARPQE